MLKISKAIAYKKNKLLKLYKEITKKGVSVIYLYPKPKNFTKNLDEAEQAVAKQKTKKNKYLSLIFFLINLCVIAVILIVQISKQEDMSISALLNSTFSPAILLFVFGMWIFLQLIDMYRTNILVKLASGRSRPCLSYKTNSIGYYYDRITPMSTGGQPFQIFYLKNRGLNTAASISVPMGKYVINQLCLSVVWTVCLIVSFSTQPGVTQILCLIGWCINSLLMVTILILSINQRVGKKIVIFVLKFLQKIKIVKNYEKRYNQVIKIVTDFQVTIKGFAKDWKNFLKLIFTNLVSMIINYLMVWFVYCSMIGWFDFSKIFEVFVMSVMIDMAASFIPLPGGTGVSELSFTALLASLISPASLLTWAMLFWRFFTYYIYLIQGLVVMAYDNIIGNRKYLWLKKKWELEAESISFTQDKLHEYTLEKEKKHTEYFKGLSKK